MKARLTKDDIMRTINKAGSEASFVANVILYQHSKSWTKLRGLALLLGRGHAVRTGQFNMDVLVMDGERTEWSMLETVK